MSIIYSAKEDRLLAKLFHAGLRDNEIASEMMKAGYSRTVTAIQCRRSDLSMLRKRGSGGPGSAWIDAEKAIAKAGLDSGKAASEIAEDLREAGYMRGSHSVRRLLEVLRLDEPQGARKAAEKRMAMKADEAFRAAMRAAHPDIKDGFAATEPSRSVPLRALPAPVFSSTGIMA